MNYDPANLEKKWQKKWEATKLNTTKDVVSGKENKMVLVEFPYPSGNLHMGHWDAFALPDMYARYQRMLGFNVMFPIGFDAFGLPAENAAIKRDIHPEQWTKENIAYMLEQLHSMGAMFDFSRVVSTIDPEYYRWTQWMFLRMQEKDLVYRAKTIVNWCPTDKTVLANEQVVDGCCDRCGTQVEQRALEQWMMRITKYADRLIDDIVGLDWPHTTQVAQQNWIGRSQGANIRFLVPGQSAEHSVEVFTTRPDTLYGVTFLVVSPELAKTWIDIGWPAPDAVKEYVASSLRKRELERKEEKEKTGVPAGFGAINPMTGQEIPIWIADYVLGSYGTGAIMAVPAHDERDFAFAQKFHLPVKIVIEPVTGQLHEHEEYRQSIVALVHDPKTEKILTLDWGGLGGTLLIGGGLEKGEDPAVCAVREIGEETGYQHVNLLGRSEVIHHHYVAQSKGVNRSIDAIGLHFELIDDHQIALEQTADEKGKFTVQWLTKAEAAQRIKDPLHRYVFEKFIHGTVHGGDGMLVDSGPYSGLPSEEAKQKIIADLEKNGVGSAKTTYKLRDWVLSRQRYWGVPIPMIHCAVCGYVPVPDADLPVTLPPLKDFKPADDGRSPLAKAEEWLKVKCPQCGDWAERETDTMDTFVDSSWYYLRYTDPDNAKAFADPAKIKAWLPVSMYIGGAEHNTMHLLYARFFAKVLTDLGYLDFPKGEPFTARRNHGIILGPDGQKMSKSKGNVVDPDKEVAQYGADTVRMYLAFMAPYEQGGPWDPKGINGVYRFLNRVWRLVGEKKGVEAPFHQEAEKALHAAIKKVGEDLANLRLNTAVSELMKALNVIEGADVSQTTVEKFLMILAPLAPHITEELWYQLGHTESIHLESWPAYDPALLVSETVEVPVQINGKVRGVITLAPDTKEDDAVFAARGDAKVAGYLEGAEVQKIVYIPGKMLNIVVKQ